MLQSFVPLQKINFQKELSKRLNNKYNLPIITSNKKDFVRAELKFADIAIYTPSEFFAKQRETTLAL